MTQTAKTMHYSFHLTTKDISNRYTIAVKKNKFDNLQGISETLTSNEKCKNAHMEAMECIPTKPRAKNRVPWETLAVRKSRDNVKTASLCNKRNPTNANTQKQRELTNAYKKNK